MRPVAFATFFEPALAATLPAFAAAFSFVRALASERWPDLVALFSFFWASSPIVPSSPSRSPASFASVSAAAAALLTAGSTVPRTASRVVDPTY